MVSQWREYHVSDIHGPLKLALSWRFCHILDICAFADWVNLPCHHQTRDCLQNSESHPWSACGSGRHLLQFSPAEHVCDWLAWSWISIWCMSPMRSKLHPNQCVMHQTDGRLTKAFIQIFHNFCQPTLADCKLKQKELSMERRAMLRNMLKVSKSMSCPNHTKRM